MANCTRATRPCSSRSSQRCMRRWRWRTRRRTSLLLLSGPCPPQILKRLQRLLLQMIHSQGRCRKSSRRAHSSRCGPEQQASHAHPSLWLQPKTSAVLPSFLYAA